MKRRSGVAPKSKISTSKRAKTPIPLDDMIVGLADAQRLIGKGETHVLMLVKTGFLKKIGTGRYRVADVAQAALKFRESEDRQSSQTEETKRVQNARAKEIELRTARAQGRLIEVEDLKFWMDETLGMFRSELWGLPAASTRDLALRSDIQKHLDFALDRIERNFKEAYARCNQGHPVTLTEDAE
jgi:phage terminase Nu1 subunit (DNA packaging protein)